MKDTDFHPLQGAAPDSSTRAATGASSPKTPAESTDPVLRFLGRTPRGLPRLTEADVPANESGLRRLAQSGSWRSVSSLSQRLLSTAHPVDELLRLRWFRITALLKLRSYAQAEREMAILGDLTGESWMFERYATLYSGRRGSMVPFSLLVQRALMPGYTGKHAESLQRLYDLLDLIKWVPWPAASWSPPEPRTLSDEDAATQRSQWQQVMLCLVNSLVTTQDYPLAIAHLEQMLGREQACAQANPSAGTVSPQTTLLHSLLGRVHIQVGNTAAAEDAFDQLDCLLIDSDGCADVRLNRGYLSVALGQYEAALAEFEAALQIDASLVTAANNRAVCLLYSCRLPEAIESLERFIQEDPSSHCHQTLLANLAVLYQMKEGGAAAKQTLEKVALAIGPDDIDTSALLASG